MSQMRSRMRSRQQPTHENNERWLLTYSDLITLLLAFFVLMYGMSDADVQKFTKMAGAMRKAFNVDVLQGMDSAGVLEHATSLLPDGGELNEPSLAPDADFDWISRELSWMNEHEGMADKVSIGVRPEGVAISISGNLLFTSGRAELRPDAIRLLQSLGKILSRVPNQVRVEGHTDDVAPSGSQFTSNWELSAARGVAVVRYLAEVEGIDPRRLSAAAFSEYQPAVPNDSPSARSKNRRSEILLLYPASRQVGTSSAASTAVDHTGSRADVQR